MNASATSRLVAEAVAASAVALGLGLLWLVGRRPAPVTVVRCPIHGIAYDAELEICPDCVKLDGETGSGILTPTEKGDAR
jgi:hypothetical protein